MPERIAAFLHTLGILLGYGRHLADTAKHRAAAPSFTSIAACFGTARLCTILAHLQRGILRATALERVLLARAARGRDIDDAQGRIRTRAAPAAPAAPPAEEPAPASAARVADKRPSPPAGWDDPEMFMPSLEELEAQARRRPLGRTIVDICLDLAVVPGLCTGPFWNELFELIRCYGGSVTTLMRARCRRETAFEKEQDRRPTRGWDWWDQKRETIRKALGFFVGEDPVDPFSLSSEPCIAAAATATGPP